jgi:hypothetical protein
VKSQRRMTAFVERLRELFPGVLRLGFLSTCALAGLRLVASAQDLAPRAYVISPIHSNAVVVSYAYFNGNLDFGGLPITDAKATANVPSMSIFHSMNFFGRTANFNASLPYGVADFSGEILNNETSVYRSGLLDSVWRFSVNLYGGPSMDGRQFVKWRQKMLIGASFRVSAPTGQYDPTKLINLGNNRWGFRPELGYSQRLGHWIVDAYAGGWFYTTNPEFFSKNQYNPGVTTLSQAPIASFEGHLSYDVKPRLWVSLDGNFWRGGAKSLNGVEDPSTSLRNSRVGGTVSVPITKHQAIKASYNDGAYIKYGGDFQNVTVGWQFSWYGKPN